MNTADFSGHIYHGMKNYFLKRPLTISFDVTNKCNLHCKMCYWQRDRLPKELSVEEAVTLFKDIRKKYRVFHCAYCGGEPTLRPEILKECTKIIPANWIITNGTRDMPKLHNISKIGVSVDGTEKIHDKIRGKGVYKQIYERYSHYTDYQVFTATTLIQSNKNEVEKLVKKWSNTNIKGMFFDFATPFRNSENKFFIDLDERDKIINRILKLKKEYGNFIIMPSIGMKYLRKKHIIKKADNCIVKWFTICLDSEGKRKIPCVLGKDAICEKCGCVVAAFAQYYFQPKLISPLIWTMAGGNIIGRMIKKRLTH